ncbi:MFS transporter [Nesterenkonia aerolata]|uniref:MFS transporter n=1 Tax=Nesterenkonia aerolata TaxID=3074079 RepID=A0ABU2DRC9_9MICC|nr:MFS transporter [Nesterenkonia sp. LY-0111]MDR8019036.1 MFS transporter [Nesterenkonia sp. LY-0111]
MASTADHRPAADASSPAPLDKRLITSWSLWSWGNATVSAVMVTFVFGTYIASEAFGPDERGTQYLTTANAIAGLIVAVTAPIIGQRADRAGKRRLWLIINTAIIVALVAACFFVRPEEGFLLLGVTLMASMTLFDEFANLNYNAMIVDITDHSRMGRVSGIGWGAGYLGGIVLLMLVYLGLITGDPPHVFGIGEDDAMNIRVVALVAAAWFLLWALPLLLTRQKTADQDTVPAERISVVESYRRLFGTLIGLWKEDRNTFWFLLASAVYRDGLSAVFTYGAILGTTLYGINPADVIIFGIAGNLVAALGAFIGGWLDDRIGPRKVIAGCLIGLLGSSLALLMLTEERVIGAAADPLLTITPTAAFWVLGLFLCLFVGPAQASSRGFLGRLAPPEKAGELFGLYATAGRSVSFLTPALISLMLLFLDSNMAIVVAIIVTLLFGLGLLVLVRNPTEPAKMRDWSQKS